MLDYRPDNGADRLYEAVPMLVQALNTRAAMYDSAYLQAHYYRKGWDVSPFRSADCDIYRAREHVFWALRDLKLEAAVVIVEGKPYTVTRDGSISPSPIARFAAKL